MFQKTAPGVQPDMICIMLGTNDYNHGIPIGEWYSEAVEEVEAAVGEPKRVFQRLHRTFLFDESTFKGRINIAVRLLKETFPGTPITFLTPIHRALFDAGNNNYQPEETWQNRCGLYLDAYIDAIKEAANVWSVNVIDLHAVSGFYPILDSDAALFYKDTAVDRLHPNDAGHKRLAEVILYQALVLPCR
jgi:lysophospholipase L1-like esterase